MLRYAGGPEGGVNKHAFAFPVPSSLVPVTRSNKIPSRSQMSLVSQTKQILQSENRPFTEMQVGDLQCAVGGGCKGDSGGR